MFAAKAEFLPFSTIPDIAAAFGTEKVPSRSRKQIPIAKSYIYLFARSGHLWKNFMDNSCTTNWGSYTNQVKQQLGKNDFVASTKRNV